MIQYEGSDDLVAHMLGLVDGAQVSVEVGAYAAEFSRQIAADHPHMRVIAMEANPHNWATYAPTMPERVEYLHAAACEHDGTVPFQVMSRVMGANIGLVAGNNGLRERSDNGIEYQTPSVPASRIDTLLARRNLTGLPNVMWWDVEGAQDRVIAGAPIALSRCLALMVEVEERAYWQGQPLAGDVDAMLQTYGLVAIARDHEFPEQHNRIYVPR